MAKKPSKSPATAKAKPAPKTVSETPASADDHNTDPSGGVLRRQGRQSYRELNEESNLIVGASVFPDREELDWFKVHAPDFLNTYLANINDEPEHRRALEKTGQRNGLIISLSALIMVTLIGLFGSPWAAAALGTLSVVLYAIAYLLLSARVPSGMIPRIRVDGRRREAEEHRDASSEEVPPDAH